MDFFRFFSLAIVCAVAVALDPKCETPASEGTGLNRTLKYHYNHHLGHCLPFFYMGECGTGNCFSTDQECMKACSQDLYPEIYPEGDSVCSLKKDRGSCFASQIKFYYDTEERMCRMFLYSGCHGNGNRFDSKEDCQAMCRAKSGRTLGSSEAPNPDEQTVDVGLIVGVLGGIVFAVAVTVAIAVVVIQRKANRAEMKKVPTAEIEMS